MEIIDARGLEQPKPLAETKKLVEGGEQELMVWVDDEKSASDVAAFLETKGYKVKREDGDETILLEAKKPTSAAHGRFKKVITE